MRKLFYLIVLILAVYSISIKASGVKNISEKEKFQEIIIRQFQRYPEMKIQDLYKFIHQAGFGSEHAVKDTAMVRRWLNEEWEKVDSVNIEPVKDTINPFDNIVRVNLRSSKFYGLSKEKILNDFINTANYYKGKKKRFEQFWNWAEQISEKIHLDKKEMSQFIKQMKKKNYPAVHHSSIYEEKYKPAYRVIMVK